MILFRILDSEISEFRNRIWFLIVSLLNPDCYGWDFFLYQILHLHQHPSL